MTKQSIVPRRQLPRRLQKRRKHKKFVMTRWLVMLCTIALLSFSITVWWLPYMAQRQKIVVSTTKRVGQDHSSESVMIDRSSKQQDNEEEYDHHGGHYLRTAAVVVESHHHEMDDISWAGEEDHHLLSSEDTNDGAIDEEMDHQDPSSAKDDTPTDDQAKSSATLSVVEHHNDAGSTSYKGDPADQTDSLPDGVDESQTVPFGYRSWEEVKTRSLRFPTVDERVRLYMSNWYAPPCENDNPESFVQYNTENVGENDEVMIFRETRTEKEKKRGPLRTFTINATVGFDELHYTDANVDAFRDCENSYCKDMVKYLFPSIPKSEGHLPILFQFSDAEKTRAYSDTKKKVVAYPNTPLFKKFRYALSRTELDRVTATCSSLPRPVPLTVVQQQASGSDEKSIITTQPIVFKLKMQRHYGYITSVPKVDRPWSEKQDKAIFRGQFTGKLPPNHKATTYLEQCMILSRCRLVHSSHSSPLVDAKLALPVLEAKKDFPMVLENVELYSERVSLEGMLSYKAIIMLEGNDVSSGLKWALFSNSVVMAQEPTKTSWAMEEYLVPWKHYIPLADDLSDVEEKMQWVIANDAKAQEIANHGRLWISDLVYHPDADRDEELIFHEIYGRYKLHFAKDETIATFADVNGEKDEQ